MTLWVLRVEDIKINSRIRMIISWELNDGVCWSLKEGASYQGSIYIEAKSTAHTNTVQDLCLNIIFEILI